MEYIEVGYNRDLKALEGILSQVRQPGDFFVAGVLEIPMPRVEVNGAGVLSFPIPAAQIDAMVRQATRAPYGRGADTVVDTAVRNVWQIAPDAIKIGGKSWPANFEGIVSQVTAGLGCQKIKVSAELYKLLVYDRGGFFLAHRDTEKTAGMFGTLVVTLPSAYSGGALRIRHANREVTVETDEANPSEISFAAFYADCEHEALPVREGNRVCLVYNLVQERPKGKGKQGLPRTPDNSAQVVEVAAVLEEYWRSPDAPPKIAWLLEHQYSPAGLSFSSLKGADAARARVLLQAAAQARCAVHLGVVHIGESGGAEEDFYVGSPGDRWRKYDAGDNDDDDDTGDDYVDDEDVSFSAISVDADWQYVDEWRDTDDHAVGFGRIPLLEGELLPAGALDQEPPDEKRLTEASGNEGATYERSYHRAALVLWPANRTMDVLLGAGVVAALPYLKHLIAGGEGTHQEAMAAAQRLVEAWPVDDAMRWSGYRSGAMWPKPDDRAAMAGALVKLEAPELLERFIRKVVVPAYDGLENEALVASVGVLGKKAAPVFAALMEARMPARPQSCVDLLLALADPSPGFGKIAKAAVAGIDGIGRRDATAGVELDSEAGDFEDWWDDRESHSKCELVPAFIENLFSALQKGKERALAEAAAKKIASRPEVFSVVKLVVPAVQQICEKKRPPADADAIEHLWKSAAEFLLARSEVPPEPPRDWRLDAKLTCTCADCKELQAFSGDPVERTHRFRIKKERRRHLHMVIDRHKLDMTHVTERRGSPQTLVCTKDRRTFQARLREYREEIAAMRDLVKLAPKISAAAGLCRRMEAAVKAGSI